MSLLNRRILNSTTLIVLGIALLLIFRKIETQSGSFVQANPGVERPLLEVLQWFAIAFGIYFASWTIVGGQSRNRFGSCAGRSNGVSTPVEVPKLGKAPAETPSARDSVSAGASISQNSDHRIHDSIVDVWWNILIVVLFGVLFRIAMVNSVPIQEIDLYRYIWDGAVVSSGHDPYRYSPKTVLGAYNDRDAISARKVLSELCELIDDKPGLKGVLEIVHFGEFTSPYPPVSQLCFATAVSACNQRATPFEYVKAMKWMLLVFDIATGFIVLMLLRQVGMPLVLSIGYWWCPLVIKEIANSGHLDSIATFFISLAILLSLVAVNRSGFWGSQPADDEPIGGLDCKLQPAVLSALSLALAVAAKVFPVLLLPLWFVFLARRSASKAILATVVFAVATMLIMWPMAMHLSPVKKYAPSLAAVNDDPVPDQSGIEAFSKFWEMNDLLYMALVENLKPAGASFSPSEQVDVAAGENDQLANGELSNEPWFRFTSESFRWQFTSVFAMVHQLVLADKERYSPQQYGFFATRIITGIAFVLFACWCCWRVAVETSPLKFLEMAFLTIAWFWLLAPTQNPWYWTWAMPLLVFARGRSWFLISGLLFIYYLRFWFGYHYDSTIVGTALSQTYPSGIFNWVFPWSESSAFAGKTFFDFYLPWYEFGPILGMLCIGGIVRYFRGSRDSGRQY